MGSVILASSIIISAALMITAYYISRMITKPINDLQVISSDSSIIEIIGIEKSLDNFSSNVKIKAKKAGTVNIALASTRFQSQEIPIQVYAGNSYATQIQTKFIPDHFSKIGPKTGAGSERWSHLIRYWFF